MKPLCSTFNPLQPISRDGGATFTAYHSAFTDGVAQSDAWTGALAMSSNGVHMYAAYNPWLNATAGRDVLANIYYDGGLVASHDGGATFQRVVIPTLGGSSIRQFTAVACSADGQKVTAVVTQLSGSYVDLDPTNYYVSAWAYVQGSTGNTVCVYSSVDGGASWSRTPVGGFIPGATMSWLSSEYVAAPLQVASDGSYAYLLQTGVAGAFDTTTGQALAGIFDDTRLVCEWIEGLGEREFPNCRTSRSPPLSTPHYTVSTNGGTTWTSAYNSNERAWLDFAVGGPNGNVVAAIWNDNVGHDGGERRSDVGGGRTLDWSAKTSNSLVRV